MTSRLLCSTAAALVGVALLAGCGGGGDDDAGDAQIASLGTAATTVVPATASDGSSSPPSDITSSASAPPDGSEIETLSSDPDEAALDYVECMRDHGIDMPDPQPGGGILVQQSADDEGDDEVGAAPVFDDEGFAAADAECQKFMEAAFGAMEIDPEREAEMQENMLEYAQCMRDHGIDMPDPQFDGDGRVAIQIGDPDGGQRMDQEEFEAANEACGQEGGGIAIGAAPAPQDGE
jgi:hypothetical protein